MMPYLLLWIGCWISKLPRTTRYTVDSEFIHLLLSIFSGLYPGINYIFGNYTLPGLPGLQVYHKKYPLNLLILELGNIPFKN